MSSISTLVLWLELFWILPFVIFLNLDLICSLHCQDDVSCLTKMILFKTDTLSKCTQIVSVRKKENLKYTKFVLPSYIDYIHGFHMSCYRKFAGLSKTQRENNNDICNQHDQPTRITRSDLTSLAISSRTRIFLKCAYFAIKNAKK